MRGVEPNLNPMLRDQPRRSSGTNPDAAHASHTRRAHRHCCCTRHYATTPGRARARKGNWNNLTGRRSIRDTWYQVRALSNPALHRALRRLDVTNNAYFQRKWLSPVCTSRQYISVPASAAQCEIGVVWMVSTCQAKRRICRKFGAPVLRYKYTKYRALLYFGAEIVSHRCC